MRTDRWLLPMLVCVGLSSAVWAQLPSKTSTPPSDGPIRVVISPQTLNAISHPKSRALLINALLATPGTKTLLDAEALKAKRTTTQLRQMTLSGTPTTAMPLDMPPLMEFRGTTPTLLPQLPVSRYENLDWNAGIEFTPGQPGPWFTTNTGARYRAGALCVLAGAFHPFSLDLSRQAALDVFAVSGTDFYIRLAAELPGAGTYMFAASAVPADGSAPVNLASAVAMEVHCGGGEIVPVAPLSDMSGVVGVCHITPYTYTPHYVNLQGTSLRRANIVIDLWSRSSRSLLFGGFTLTRL